MHRNKTLAAGKRWLLTDGRVYDWWDLASAWGDSGTSRLEPQASSGAGHKLSGNQPTWVRELMQEHGVHALPRSPEELGRCLDSRDFWQTFDLYPVKARLEYCPEEEESSRSENVSSLSKFRAMLCNML